MRMKNLRTRLLSENPPAAAEEDGHENVAAEAWQLLGVVSQWITNADAKAGAILAACGIVGGFLYSVVKDGAYTHKGWVHTLAIVCAVLLTASAASAGFALRPRRRRDSPPQSLLYFDYVARQTIYSEAEYVTALTGLLRDPKALAEQIGMQVYQVSLVASAKYSWVNRALFAFLAALTALGALMSVASLR